MASHRVCPKPILWNDIYQHLEYAWIQNGRNGPSPPRPLVISLWHYSNDMDKKDTWDRTIDWARQRGLQHLIPEIEPDQAYIVSQLTDWRRIGPMGGPMYLEWDFSAKAEPSEARLRSALSALISNWAEIAVSELSSIRFRFDLQVKAQAPRSGSGEDCSSRSVARYPRPARRRPSCAGAVRPSIRFRPPPCQTPAPGLRSHRIPRKL